MRIRPGLCQNCGARYQIPDSFTHDRARCRQCGGEVRVEPAVADTESAQVTLSAEPLEPPLARTAPAVAAAPVRPSAAPLPPRPAPHIASVPPAPPRASTLPPTPAIPQAAPPIRPPAASAIPIPIPARAPLREPAPAAPAQPAPAPAAQARFEVEAPKKPSAMEMIRARRAAEEAAADAAKASQGAGRGAAAPAATPAATRPLAPAPRPPAARPAVTPAAPAAGPRRTPPTAATPAPARSTAPRTGPDAARGGGRRSARGSGDDAGGARGRGGRGRAKGSPKWGLIGVGGLLVAAVVGYYLFTSGAFDKSPAGVAAQDAQPATENSATPRVDPFAAFGDVGADAGAPGNGANDDVASADSAAKAPEGSTATPPAASSATGGAGAAPAARAPESGEPVAQTGRPPLTPQPTPAEADRNPAEVDLASIADFEAPPGVAPETWAEWQEHVLTLTDTLSGARGGRASRALIEAGRDAVPAIINQFKRIDFSATEGMTTGVLVHKTLEGITNGVSFGWQRGTTPNNQFYNRRVVQRWAEQWQKAIDDPAAWDEFARPAPVENGGEGGEGGGAPADEPENG